MKAVLVLGSNCGDRRGFILRAGEMVSASCTVLGASDIYESPDCLGSGRRYLNMVLEVESPLPEESLNSLFKSFECACGRSQMARERGEVPVDIDIVLWGGFIRRPSDFRAAYFRRGYENMVSGPLLSEEVLKI